MIEKAREHGSGNVSAGIRALIQSQIDRDTPLPESYLQRLVRRAGEEYKASQQTTIDELTGDNAESEIT